MPEIVIEDVQWPKTMFEAVPFVICPNCGHTEPDEKREDGYHLSTVVKSLQDAAGLGYKGTGFNDMELTAEIGLLWERALSRIMGEKFASRPPQICEDNIWMSPDGIGPDPEDEVPLVVEEYKCTWQSTKRSPLDNFYYMAQVKSYCRAVGTTVAIMRIFHIMGDYKGSGPIYRVARIRFTQHELDQNWNMITNHLKEMEEDK